MVQSELSILQHLEPRRTPFVRFLLHFATLCVLFISHPALAAELVPPPPLIGDGVSTATLQILTDSNAARAKIKPSSGTIGTMNYVPGGVLVQYTPPAVQSPQTVSLLIQLRGGQKSDFTAQVQVLPPWSHGYQVTVEPETITTAESAMIKVKPTAAAPVVLDSRALDIAVSHGEVTPLTPTGDGSWVASYTPPADAKEPIRVAVAVADQHATMAYGSGHLAVTVQRNITVDTDPDSSNLLHIGDLQYGPFKASPTGKVAFSAQLHPSQASATLETIQPNGTKSNNTIYLPISARTSAVLAPTPPQTAVNQAMPVVAVCFQPGGGNCPVGAVALTASDGTVSALKSAASNGWVGTWTPGKASTSLLTLQIGEVSNSRSVGSVSTPNQVQINTDPAALSADTSSVVVTATAADNSKAPALTVQNAKVYRSPRAGKDGSISGTWRIAKDVDNVTIIAHPKGAVTTRLPQTLLAWTSRLATGVGGSDSTVLILVGLTEGGLLTPDLEFTLSTSSGDIQVPNSVTANSDGVAVVALNSGNSPGLQLIDVSAAGLRSRAILWQTEHGKTAPQLYDSGTNSDIRALQAWRNRIPVLHSSRTAPPPVAAPTIAPVPSTDPTVASSSSPTAPPTASPPPVPVNSDVQGTSGTQAEHSTAMLRVRYGIGMTPFSYRAKLKGDATDTFPPTAAFNVIPITLAAGAEGWFGPNNTIGATINLRMSFYGLDTGTPDVLHVRTPLDFDVGGRYRFDLFASPWSAWAGLSFSKSSSMIFQYEDETRSTAVVDVQAVLGVRASGGFRGEWDKLLIEADLGSTFTPIPSIGVGIKGEYRIHDAILVGAAIGTELRAVSIKPDSNESVRINATEFGQQFHLYSGLAF